ncbi:hypothetical protein MRB53_040505 [Persea americana]|nr:hypothetical protein MRB53_040505 [Persea americana]
MNESPIIDAGFLKPLVDLLGSTDNEEIQCHAISTLRNLAASSDRNKQLVLQAGAVQKCKELVLSVPLSVQFRNDRRHCSVGTFRRPQTAVARLGRVRGADPSDRKREHRSARQQRSSSWQS